eukprot:Blabericola_migrator_1__8885@NODE_46_length_16830_cov_132_783392_g42_i0_p6_GENE_NODE_46_length_16830_cov_132_783392_g42_i0NODE_46_length_16830_cov_132_783392_g42_i0_p6_ORF_typecomplete_len357_score19_06Sushi/PF00084_20/1_9e03Sushi/PF00084_20/1_7e03Sushi/PF00084_20/2e03Sushi/PF00084_20/0_038IL23/PF16649_5/5IL23/PF16649_5/5_3e02IL23/PF16649_5/2_5e02_NODE_46_length_16830_cov_132_783392_g42_i059927062
MKLFVNCIVAFYALVKVNSLNVQRLVPASSVAGLSKDSGGLRVIEEFGGVTTCPEEYVYKNGVCQTVLKQAPMHSCPQNYHLVEGQCLGIFHPELSCPSNYLLMANDFCERTSSIPCEVECPDNSLRTEEGLCLREVEAPSDYYCLEGTLDVESKRCVNRIHSKPIITCHSDKATYEDGYCTSVEETDKCDPNDLVNHIDGVSGRTCLRLRSTAPKISCAPGSWLDRGRGSCIRAEFTPAQSVCRKTMSNDRCVDNIYVHPLQSCPAPFVKKSVFGLCTCQLVERANPIQSCLVNGAAYDPTIGRCVHKSMIRFHCPSGYKLHGTICERLVEAEAVKTFNITVACVLHKGQMDCGL